MLHPGQELAERLENPEAPDRTPWAVRGLPAAVVVAVLAVVMHRGGVAVVDIGLYALRIVVAVLLPGVLLSRLVRTGRRTGIEDLAFGFAVGTLVQVPVWWLFLKVGLSYWAWPVLVVAVVAAVPAARGRVRAVELDRTPLAWSASVAAVCLVALAWLRGDFLRWSPPEPGASHMYYGDLLFHLSVAADAKRAVPPTLPQVAGDPLYYHWFSHLDIGLASQMTGIELATVLFQMWVPVTLLAGIVIVAACGSRLTGRRWAGPLAAVLVYGSGEIAMTSWNARPFTPMTQFISWASPSQTAAAIFAVPAAAVVVDYLRGDLGSTRQLWVLGVPLFFGLALAKSAELPVFIGGAGLLLVVALLRRERPLVLRSLVAGALLAGSFVTSVVVLYGGQGGGLSLSPLFSMRRYALAYLNTGMDPSPTATTTTTVVAVSVVTAIWAVSVLGRTWGVLLLLPRWRTADPGQVLLAGALLAGAGAYLLLTHPGGSQSYFLISAFPLGALASAWAICEWAPRLDRTSAVVTGALVVAAGLAAFASTDLIGETRPSEGFLAQVLFLGRPVLLVVAVAALLCLLVVVLHRRGRLQRISAVTVVTGVLIAAGVPMTLQYTFSSLPSSSIAKQRAEDPDNPAAITGKGVAASRWLRDHTDADTVIATNRHCFEGNRFPGPGPRTRCDILSFWVSGWTERRVLVEGWAFGHKAVQMEVENGMTYKRQPFWDPALLRVNDGFFASPTAREAAVLCEHGATYAFLDRRFQPKLPSLEPVAEEVYANADAEVYRLPC